MKERFWELAGSKLGNLMNMKKEVEEDPDKMNVTEDGEYDYRASSRYHTALQRHSQGQSDFAKNKTIKE